MSERPFARAFAPIGRATKTALGDDNDGLDAQGAVRLGVYALVGMVVGVSVAAIEVIAVEVLLHAVLEADLWVQAVVPGVGIAVSATLLYAARTGASTSDEYIRAYHSNERLPLRPVLPRIGAAIATIGSGGAVGLEAPSIYSGSVIGQRLGARFERILGPGGAHTLLVAGASAGVAAVFKAPATGVLFALESPYRRDSSANALIPCLVASAASYLSFVTLLGTERFLPVNPGEVLLRDEILGALLVGLLAGVAARLLATLFHWAKERNDVHHPVLRVAVGAALLAGAVLATNALVDVPVTLGPGADLTVDVILDPAVGLWTIAALFALRAIATASVFGAGGVGGVFIPLVVQGLLLGRIVEGLVGAESSGLYPAIGLAAVLGAGYRVPLAAVMFVAETTGQATFVIPALLATAVSQALMGSVSVASGQVHRREGMLEGRLRRPVSDVTVTGVRTVAPDEALADIVDTLGDTSGATALVVFDTEYRGLLILRDIATVMFNQGFDATVADAMVESEPVYVDQRAVDAGKRMAAEDTAVLAVLDHDGRSIGVVTAISLSGLAEVEDPAGLPDV